MTQEQLQDVMKFHLTNFNKKKGLEITDDTIHEEAIVNTKRIKKTDVYRGIIRVTMIEDGGNKADKPWPRNWMKLSVKELAEKILILFFIMLSSFAASAQLQVNVSAIKTELKENAIKIGVHYVRSLDSAWQVQDYIIPGKNSFFLITPEAKIETGTEDAFSSIVFKVSGLLAKFKWATVSGIKTPDSRRTIHLFPISVGAETNNLFDRLNAIVEAGWTPHYQAATSSTPEFFKHTEFGVYLQAGYKFKFDSSASVPKGGEVDESSEQLNESLFRAKFSGGIETGTIVRLGGVDVNLEGNADVWRDFKNGVFYHRIDFSAKFNLTPESNIELKYQKGSGAPNFNQGSQWGAGLNIAF